MEPTATYQQCSNLNTIALTNTELSIAKCPYTPRFTGQQTGQPCQPPELNLVQFILLQGGWADSHPGSFGDDLVCELFASAELLDVLHGGGSDIGQRLLCEEGRVWRDEHIWV